VSSNCECILFITSHALRPLGIQVVVQSTDAMNFDQKDVAGFLFQYPNTDGSIVNIENVIQAAKKNNVTKFNS